MRDYLTELRARILSLHGCAAAHVKTVPVKEVFQGQTVWDGEVEVFDLIGHAKAKRCYAWGYPNAKDATKLDVVAVLEMPPVVSPEKAVRAAIAASAKREL